MRNISRLKQIEYFLTLKSNLRSIRVSLEGGKVIVKAPSYLPVETIDRFIDDNAGLIREKLLKQQSQKLKAGSAIWWKGQRYKVEKSCRNSYEDKVHKIIYCSFDKEEYDGFVLKEASKYLSSLFDEVFLEPAYAELSQKPGLSFGFYKSIWGSYRPQRYKISLNANLIYYPAGCALAIIHHELTHIFVASHQKEFYARLIKNYPKYRQYESMLKSLEKPYC